MRDVTESRTDYYKRCQDIADYIYGAWKKAGRFISDQELIAKFGKTDYSAFMHEINELCADQSQDSWNETIEWIWRSRHFSNKELREIRDKEAHNRSNMAIWVSIVSVIISLVALIRSFF